MYVEPAERLRAAGLKVTRGRVATLQVLTEHSHATAEQLHGRIAGGGVPMTLAAVYLALSVLTDRGLLRRIEPAGGPARYEVRVGDNHHHLVCTGCDRVVDVDCATGSAPCLTPADTHGFSVATAEITFWGTCPDCASGAHEEGGAA
ncbi:Fur family transcriptional regulator [Amnibacterium endophyticum]|uniref:Fur family transcriptional regulator n=1 Tax=Amnibacterium endophyticum TaxID=2109337 RepID=A0ABW4LG57_9MICO